MHIRLIDWFWRLIGNLWGHDSRPRRQSPDSGRGEEPDGQGPEQPADDESGGETPATPVSTGQPDGGGQVEPNGQGPEQPLDVLGGQPGRPEQERPAYEPPENPLLHRETVRMMLLLHYQQQGASGQFRVTASVRSELCRLIPALHEEDIHRLSAPDPSNSTELFKWIIDAGYLPLEPAASEPK